MATLFRRAVLVAGLLAIAASAARGQSAPLNPANAKAFLGVWVIEMTEPAVFRGTHTIRVWDNGGVIAASLQTNPKFPAIEATGIHKDGNMPSRRASGPRCPGSSMACSSTWTALINISNEQRPQVR